MHDGDRLSPVSLPRKDPVAKLVAHLRSREPSSGERLDDRSFAGVGIETGWGPRIHHHDPGTVVDERSVCADRRAAFRGDHWHDRETEGLGELVVALVVRRHRHDRASAVAGEHVVGDPDRHPRAVHRVHRERACGHAGLRPWRRSRRSRSLLFFAAATYAADRGALRSGRDLVDQRVLGSEHDVSRAEERVGPRSEHHDRPGLARRPSATRNVISAPSLLPIHSRCIVSVPSGQSSRSRSSSSRSAYAVMRSIHCRSLRRSTRVPQRSTTRPASPLRWRDRCGQCGHQLIGATSSYARPRSKSLRKIHCVQRT